MFSLSSSLQFPDRIMMESFINHLNPLFQYHVSSIKCLKDIMTHFEAKSFVKDVSSFWMS